MQKEENQEKKELLKLPNDRGISVIIPAFNEERNIARVIIHLKKILSGTKSQILVVDDGSADLTGEIAKELGADVISHDRTEGYGASLITGFQNSRYDIIVTMDADGQHDPKEIPRLIKPIIEDSADVVIGSRFQGEIRPGSMGVGNKIGNKIVTAMLGVRKNISDSQSGFRAYKKEVIKNLVLEELGMEFTTEILLKVWEKKATVVEVPITYRPRENVSYSSFSFARHGFKTIMLTLKYLLPGRTK
jgi:glycosyltransferase involved in cell wall biosynthesis